MKWWRTQTAKRNRHRMLKWWCLRNAKSFLARFFGSFSTATQFANSPSGQTTDDDDHHDSFDLTDAFWNLESSRNLPPRLNSFSRAITTDSFCDLLEGACHDVVDTFSTHNVRVFVHDYDGVNLCMIYGKTFRGVGASKDSGHARLVSAECVHYAYIKMSEVTERSGRAFLCGKRVGMVRSG